MWRTGCLENCRYADLHYMHAKKCSDLSRFMNSGITNGRIQMITQTLKLLWGICLFGQAAFAVDPGTLYRNTIPEDKQLDPAWVQSLTERGHAPYFPHIRESITPGFARRFQFFRPYFDGFMSSSPRDGEDSNLPRVPLRYTLGFAPEIPLRGIPD